jgi:hypothetical protein
MPGKLPLKASQRGRVRPVVRSIVVPIRETGTPVRWKDRRGIFKRDCGDGEHSEIQLDDRIWRVKTSELVG